MDAVGRGTELGGRYRLTEQQPSDPSGPGPTPTQGRTEHADWRALDVRLNREVLVRVVRGPAAEDVLDAGRRAAVVDDPRLQRVLDVGTHQPGGGAPLIYVVVEWVAGATLSRLVDPTPQLPPARVRAVVGEIATALARAAEVGVHHGALRPSVVLRTDDGQVKLAGLAVDAATRGVPVVTSATGPGRGTPSGPSDAESADALGLVALLYAGLTGRWPLPEVAGWASGLQPAPAVQGFAVPPDDLVGGVPNDLDTLCSVVFGPHDDGPRTPAEVVEQLRPWVSLQEPPPGPARTHARPAAAGSASGPAPTAPATTAPATGATRPKRTFPLRRAAVDSPAATASVPSSTTPAATPAVLTTAAPVAEHPLAPLAHGDDPDAPATAGRGFDRHLYQEVQSDEDSRSRLVLVVVAVVVVLGLAFALNSLRGITDIGGGAADTPSAAETTTPPPAEAEAPAPEQPAAGAVPVVVGIRSLDPEGDDGTENDDSAPRAIDRDPATFWNSSSYANAAFGGLKEGVGLVLPLSAPTLVSGATVSVNGTGGSVELRAAPTQSLDDSTVLASGVPVDGVVELAAQQPVEAANVVLWFTELPEVSGEYRLEVGEVQLR